MGWKAQVDHCVPIDTVWISDDMVGWVMIRRDRATRSGIKAGYYPHKRAIV